MKARVLLLALAMLLPFINSPTVSAPFVIRGDGADNVVFWMQPVNTYGHILWWAGFPTSCDDVFLYRCTIDGFDFDSGSPTHDGNASYVYNSDRPPFPRGPPPPGPINGVPGLLFPLESPPALDWEWSNFTVFVTYRTNVSSAPGDLGTNLSVDVIQWLPEGGGNIQTCFTNNILLPYSLAYTTYTVTFFSISVSLCDDGSTRMEEVVMRGDSAILLRWPSFPTDGGTVKEIRVTQVGIYGFGTIDIPDPPGPGPAPNTLPPILDEAIGLGYFCAVGFLVFLVTLSLLRKLKGG